MIIILILLLIVITLLGQWLHRERDPEMVHTNPDRRRRRRSNNNPSPQRPTPRPLGQRVQRWLTRYLLAFAYHCGLGVALGTGLAQGLANPETNQLIKTQLMTLGLLVITMLGIMKLPVISGLTRSAMKQFPKKPKTKAVHFCWTNSLTAMIVMFYMATRNAYTLF